MGRIRWRVCSSVEADKERTSATRGQGKKQKQLEGVLTMRPGQDQPRRGSGKAETEERESWEGATREAGEVAGWVASEGWNEVRKKDW